jgi:hypothetical protein
MKIGEGLKKLFKDPLSRALATGVTALAAAVAAFLLGGPAQPILIALASIAAIALAAGLVMAGDWQDRELGEIGFEKMRDKHAEKHDTTKFERELRKMLCDAREHKPSNATVQAQLDGCLEKHRRKIASRRASGIELIVLDFTDSEKPTVLTLAGRFDSEHLKLLGESPFEEWMEELSTDAPYTAHMRVSGRSLRLVAVSDTGIGIYDKTLVERTATHFQEFLQILEDRGSGASGLTSDV